MEEKIRNLTFIVLVGFIILFLLIIGLYFKGDSASKTTTAPESSGGGSQTTTTYDVSKMNEIDPKNIMALLNDKKTHILYIGRSTCSVCTQTVPVLNQVQDELNYTTDYLALDIKSKESDEGDGHDWDTWQSLLKEFTSKMEIEASANGEKGKMGDLFYNNGFTPTIVIIKDGKVVDGFIGYRSADTIKEIVQKYL